MRARPLLFLPLALALAACAAPPPAPQQTRALSILMGADVSTLDPQASFDDVSAVILVNIFETLVRFDNDFRLSPGLAQRWINPDDRTWRFFLDGRARFSDGSALTAGDVKFSIERLKGLAGSQLSGFVRHVTSVDAVDELTVDIHTDTPVAILNGLAFIPVMSEKHVRSAGDRVGRLPFGTGPYKLTGWDQRKSIVLEANEHRHPLPDVRRAEFTLHDGGIVLDDLLKLRPHLTLFLRRAEVEDFEKRRGPGLKLVSSDGLTVYYLTFNLAPRIAGHRGANPLRDVRVRRALAQAVDREELVRAALKGLGRPASQLIIPQVFGFNPRAEPPPYDPQAAREQLARAGASGLELPFDTVQGGSHMIEKLLIAQWGKIGVKASLREMPAELRQRSLETDSFAVTLEGYGCTSGDASELLTFCLHARDPAKGYGPGNHAGYSNPEMDRITEENLRIFDPKKRLEMLQRALGIATDELPYIPLVSVRDVYVVSDDIRWTPPVNAEIRLSEISFRPGPGRASGR